MGKNTEGRQGSGSNLGKVMANQEPGCVMDDGSYTIKCSDCGKKCTYKENLPGPKRKRCWSCIDTAKQKLSTSYVIECAGCYKKIRVTHRRAYSGTRTRCQDCINKSRGWKRQNKESDMVTEELL